LKQRWYDFCYNCLRLNFTYKKATRSVSISECDFNESMLDLAFVLTTLAEVCFDQQEQFDKVSKVEGVYPRNNFNKGSVTRRVSSLWPIGVVCFCSMMTDSKFGHYSACCKSVLSHVAVGFLSSYQQQSIFIWKEVFSQQMTEKRPSCLHFLCSSRDVDIMTEDSSCLPYHYTQDLFAYTIARMCRLWLLNTDALICHWCWLNIETKVY